ncbi:MAG TPA: hypothetical protein ENG14_05830 [Thermodesulforhabdus norvegica]|uniref:Uncharacterized protein n=1 Tax=Thermodesulforhabdus norvegica TaxID=39841 RepID=A0A7C0WW30_9BACT|nr:hypothetical protein [Thermodesulforhabdus norvegica]
MPTRAELGDVILQGLASLFNCLRELFVYLIYTGHNESIAGRGDYQSFWQIWYNATAAITWARKMLFEPYGFVWQINHNATLNNEFGNVVSTAANSSLGMLGNASGTSGITFLLRVATERVLYDVNNNTIAVEFGTNLWYAVKYLVLLVSDALRVFPTYFP